MSEPSSTASRANSAYSLVGKGRLQLRQSGKHLVLMTGFKDVAVKFKAEKFIDSDVEIFVRLTGKLARKKRVSPPRIRYL